MNNLSIEQNSPVKAVQQGAVVPESKSLLRFLTCGSVDDGKSTLIGRLLYDTEQIYQDHLLALHHDSKRLGSQGEQLDLALLVDGLQAEREQGITIDVAYRYFSSSKRKFIIADTPGHEQYTRNMATGASTCDLAILLLDARKGVLAQTRRHSFIATLLGIRQLVVAVNKMDLVDYQQQVFEQCQRDYLSFSAQLPDDLIIHFVPLSALEGDNVVKPSTVMPWYHGKTLLQLLEQVEVVSERRQQPLRFPVQYVNRPNLDFRGYAGTLSSGILQVGQPVKVLPSGLLSTVTRIVTFDGDQPRAIPGQAITLVLADQIDISRGDLLVAADDPLQPAQCALVEVVWMSEQPLVAGQRFDIKLAGKKTRARVTTLRYQVDINSLTQHQSEQLPLNGIGLVELLFDEPLALDSYRQNSDTGGLIFIDCLSNVTVGAGLVQQAISGTSVTRAENPNNVVWHSHPVTRLERELLHGHKGAVVWFTGLSGAGKSTIAGALEQQLHQLGVSTYLLDGDNVRHGLCRDLGFSVQDRQENIRRAAEVAKLLADAGVLVLAAFISPHRAEREMVRNMLDQGRFIEVFVDTPQAVCEQRDPKGLYQRARAGELTHFTGVDADYQPPERPDVRLDGKQFVTKLTAQLLDVLRNQAIIRQ
ncbi:sulfate adenylyltransferase subunit CysN [Serratia microhaemolytica]|uniref:sulfate adenylyltransferase subunit CysN n=1 Tax=Serratia microhaemolytica TaxID=2675110 RepID=UPI000FDD5F6F|nr:sulfate adenylyltransferase subunit CysN [Serratia microhaemolytica]